MKVVFLYESEFNQSALIWDIGFVFDLLFDPYLYLIDLQKHYRLARV